jgi:hypothetical protein
MNIFPLLILKYYPKDNKDIGMRALRDFFGFTTMKRPTVKKPIGVFYSFRCKAKSAYIFLYFCNCKRDISSYADMGISPYRWPKLLALYANYHGVWIRGSD